MPIGSNGPSLTIIGDICIDFVMGPVDRWPTVGTETIVGRNEMRAGGSAGNAALTMRHVGSRCSLISRTGDDTLGGWLGSQFEGIELAIGNVGAPTSISTGVVHRCGERTLFTTRGHLEEISWGDLKRNVSQAAPGDIALLTGVFLLPKMRASYSEIITHLRSLGYEIAIDTGWPSHGWNDATRQEVYGWLKNCDHVLLNEAEVRGLSSEDDLQTALTLVQEHMGPTATLVAKVGPEGAIGCRGAERCAAAAPSIEPFDTIGAGDAFNAGYLAATLAANDLQRSLEAGCRTASQIISRFPRSAIAPGEIRGPAILESAK